jgi:hypothetical protein
LTMPMKEKLTQNLLTLLEAYRTAPGALAETTAGKRSSGWDNFYPRMRNGDFDFKVGTYDRVVQWYSDHWRDGGEPWPADIFRPEKRTAVD